MPSQSMSIVIHPSCKGLIFIRMSYENPQRKIQQLFHSQGEIIQFSKSIRGKIIMGLFWLTFSDWKQLLLIRRSLPVSIM
mmetsp:Transcript_15960/g.21793  ORF Transcript_15960/g.21793 Transcript_15960/m.21793 type:complete len:80 (-) Transcript_15960:17-256(-)